MDRQEMMGKIVTVTHQLVRKSNGYSRWWESESLEEPRPGWVTGFRTLQNGTVSVEREYGYREYEQRYWNCHNTTPAILVTFWPTLNPIHVPLDGVVIGGNPQPYPTLPDFDVKPFGELMREEMEYWPRDNKGRWLAAKDITQEQWKEMREAERLRER